MKLLLFFCLSISSVAEKLTGHRVTCPTDSVEAETGGNATFQCRLVPPLNLLHHTIDWKREDSGELVHVYRHKQDDSDSQAERYRGRTTFDLEELDSGLLRLRISPVQLSDSGSYRCCVPQLHTHCSINLIVEEPGTKGHPLGEEPELDPPGGAAVVVPTAATLGLCLLLSSILRS